MNFKDFGKIQKKFSYEFIIYLYITIHPMSNNCKKYKVENIIYALAIPS